MGVQQTRTEVLRNAETALSKLARDRTQAELDQNDHLGLEAVIQLTGRPSVLIKDGDLDLEPDDPDLGQWLGTVYQAREGMKRTIQSVGRIDRDGIHIGTGFVVGPSLVMTNRHVLQGIAHISSRSAKGGWSMLGGTPTIDFAMEYGSPRSRRFEITGVAYAGPTAISGSIDIGKLDLALLRLDPSSGEGQELPQPLPLTKSVKAGQGKSEVYMVGYPGRPALMPTGRGEDDLQLVDTLKRVFRMRYGYKRLALGFISHSLGEVPNDPIPWAIGHNATTLGGNSGSCVVALQEEGSVLGLHFGGIFFDHNLAHVLAAVPALTSQSAASLGFAWR